MRAKLIEIAGEEDQMLSSMADHMKLKFQKYWEEEGNLNYLLFIAVILDPRYKLQYLKFCLDILYGPYEGKELAEKIESTLDELFCWYIKTVNASSSNRGSNQAPIHISVDEEDEENPWDMLASQFEQHMEEIESEPNDSELTSYLAEKREKRAKEFDILEYWKMSSNKYPVLSLLAKDVLAIPASTVPSESAFSTGGRIIDPLRCSLSTSTVEALICAQSWLHTSHTKVSAREAAEEVQTYEEIREEFLSKDRTDNQHCIDLTELEA
ncbi:zinc finger BED domain-containing protein RICESLEEPER 1-like [Setaria viridis]|uniref:zinc finger BED domain-containing protein RICESLEEPER 1-like n=1 Tax=Setaria viridis TaxID=4556 RepID=UPI003B3B9470